MLFLIWTVALADILPVRDTHVQTGRAPLYDEDVDKWWKLSLLLRRRPASYHFI